MKKILIIENVNSFSEEVTLFLQYKDFIVFHAHNEEMALETALNEKPDTIICFCNMTGVDAFQILDAFKNEPGLENIPFIFLTSMVEEEYIQKIKKSRAVAYLVKPFALDELGQLLKNIVH